MQPRKKDIPLMENFGTVFLDNFAAGKQLLWKK